MKSSSTLRKSSTVAMLPRSIMEKGIRIRALTPTITEWRPMGQKSSTEGSYSKLRVPITWNSQFTV
jgi:hypothetical protein